MRGRRPARVGPRPVRARTTLPRPSRSRRARSGTRDAQRVGKRVQPAGKATVGAVEGVTVRMADRARDVPAKAARRELQRRPGRDAHQPALGVEFVKQRPAGRTGRRRGRAATRALRRAHRAPGAARAPPCRCPRSRPRGLGSRVLKRCQNRFEPVAHVFVLRREPQLLAEALGILVDREARAGVAISNSTPCGSRK